MRKKKNRSREGYVKILRPYFTRNGKRFYASSYGKKVFTFWVKAA